MRGHGFVTLSWATLACFSVPLVSSIHPAHAVDTAIGVCEAKSNVVRVYKRNSELKLRVFDRIKNVTWLDTPATTSTNPEVVEYSNIRGETKVVVQFSRNSSTCNITIGGKLETGRVTQGNPGGSGGSNPPEPPSDTTIGVCDAKSSIARVYKRNSELKLRVFNRIENATWLDTPATTSTNPEMVEYSNIRGETKVVVQFSRNSSTCNITIGSKLESGRVTEGNPGG